MKKANFTLIEILGVIVLIVILAAIGIASYMYAVESSKESATKATIERINAGVDGLNNSNGLMLKTLSGGKTEFVNITAMAKTTIRELAMRNTMDVQEMVPIITQVSRSITRTNGNRTILISSIIHATSLLPPS